MQKSNERMYAVQVLFTQSSDNTRDNSIFGISSSNNIDDNIWLVYLTKKAFKWVEL